MANPHVITVQPHIVTVTTSSRNYWQTGLLDCCSDFGVCFCGLFCYPCLPYQIASDMDECCLCGSTVAMRTLYRTKYNIPGSILSDYCTVLWCPVCSACQIKRDIKKRKELGIF